MSTRALIEFRDENDAVKVEATCDGSAIATRLVDLFRALDLRSRTQSDAPDRDRALDDPGRLAALFVAWTGRDDPLSTWDTRLPDGGRNDLERWNGADWTYTVDCADRDANGWPRIVATYRWASLRCEDAGDPETFAAFWRELEARSLEALFDEAERVGVDVPPGLGWIARMRT